ncbi:hypothetical protein Tco_0846722 [Tanacetum coccineum]
MIVRYNPRRRMEYQRRVMRGDEGGYGREERELYWTQGMRLMCISRRRQSVVGNLGTLTAGGVCGENVCRRECMGLSRRALLVGDRYGQWSGVFCEEVGWGTAYVRATCDFMMSKYRHYHVYLTHHDL